MPIPVVIGGSTYQLPVQGDSPAWGDNLSDIIQALIVIANNTQGSGDISTTNFSILNNITSPTNVTGLLFNSSSVRSAVINYSIDRNTTTTEFSESGQITITFNSLSGTWEMAQMSVGNAGVTFSVPASGQFQYVSTNMSSGTNYTGNMVFYASSFETA